MVHVIGTGAGTGATVQIERPLSASELAQQPPGDIRMVAIGDSITAGTQDACTVQERQQVCYAQQIARHAGLPWVQPHIDRQGIPFSVFHEQTFDVDTMQRHIFWAAVAAAPLGLFSYFIGPPPVIIPTWNLLPDLGRRTEASRGTASAPQSNFAVAGFELRHVLGVGYVRDYLREIHSGIEDISALGHTVPLIRAILGNGTSNGLGTQIDQAAAQNPDLVLCWAGNNDALSAVFGGVLDDHNLTPVDDRPWRFALRNPITGGTSETVTDAIIPGFRTQVLGPGGLIDQLLSKTSAEIMLMNIPDVTVIPLLKETGKPVGPLPFRVLLQNGEDVTDILEHWVVPDEVRGEGKNGRTQYPPGTRVSLSTLLSKLVSGGAPGSKAEMTARMQVIASEGYFWESEVLDPDEMATIQTRIREFNRVLAEGAQRSPRIHLVDIHSELLAAKLGRKLLGPGPDEWVVPGFTGAPDPRGRDGIFSYDGVHPSDTGHAVISNIILNRIQADLAHNPKFARFRNLPPVDEKAVHRADPHNGAQPLVIFLDPAHIEQWKTQQMV